MSTDPKVDYRTEPSRYRHWKLAFDGPIATLAAGMAIRNRAGGTWRRNRWPRTASRTKSRLE